MTFLTYCDKHLINIDMAWLSLSQLEVIKHRETFPTRDWITTEMKSFEMPF